MKYNRTIIPYQEASLAQLDADVCIQYPSGVAGRYRYFSVPRFLIIGAAKCGTQELLTWLDQHPNLRGLEQEGHFFNDVMDIAQEWPRYVLSPKFLISKKEEHFTHFPIHTFEKTPAYIWRKNRGVAVPTLVKQIMPSGKFIAILRNPVDRAYSVFQMGKRGTDINPAWTRRMPASFEDYILEDGQLRSDRNIIKVSHYAEHSPTWLKHFSREQLLVLTMEDFKKNPFQLINKVQDFLEIPHFDYQTLATQTNRGFWVLKGQASKAYNKPYEKLKTSTRQILEAHYAPWNAQLRELFPELHFPW